ncbi:hypothetical protein V8E54_002169 [Elaphomyces granulatus]
MLSSSIRRVVRPPAVSLPVTSPLGASVNNTAAVHQRRYSSSKPPVPPNNGSRPLEASSQTPTKGVSPSGTKRDGKAAKRRGKDNGRNGIGRPGQQTAFLNLPSVPSTQHLQPHDVHVASFFSIHRPISVTNSVPAASSAEAFDAIFTSKKRPKTEIEHVTYSLTSAIDQIEKARQKQEEQDDLRRAVTRASISNPESDPVQLEAFSASIEELTSRLPPFNPPVPPTPFTDESENEMVHHEHRDITPTSLQTFSTLLTIRESTHSDGHKTYEAHASPFVQNNDLEAPGGFDGEGFVNDPPGPRKTHIERLLHTRTMFAISVKRQRRLKMKKHKFKKLLRKTRTLRRKLEKS